MSNIVIPTQDHQVKALEQPSGQKNSKESGTGSKHIVLPTQDHQIKLFEQGDNKSNKGSANVSNVVIPNKDQMKAFETKETKQTGQSRGCEADDGEFHDTQFKTSVLNLLNSSGNTIFSKYARQFEDVTKKLDSGSGGQLIVFTPTDGAIESLNLKPWEFPEKVTMQNDLKDEVSSANIKNFLNSHIVDSSADFGKVSEGKGANLKTVNGNKLQLVNNDNQFQVIIDGKAVANVTNSQIVGNGALLTIDHPLEWPGK